jgi:hypothetical protein
VAKKTNGAKDDHAMVVRPMKLQTITLTIRGTTPLIQHCWSEKGLKSMRMTAAERKKIPKVAREPEEEGNAAAYRCADGQYGVPAMAVKSSMIEAAHKDVTGLPKTTVRKALRFREAGVIPMVCSDPFIREDIVRVGMGGTDLRYRPQFDDWSVRLTFAFDSDLLNADDVISLVNRAGFSVGIGEWRPEKDGEYGTFEVDDNEPVDVK